MNFAQEKQGASRFTGFGIVVLIHAVIVWAFVSGLAQKVIKKVVEPIETKVIEEQVKPPPPPEKVVPPPPDLKAPPPPFVPPPEFVVTAPAPPQVITAPTSNVPPPTTTVAAAPAPRAPAPPAAAPVGPQRAGAVCTKMSKPELPSISSWQGTAEFRVTAVVKAGRVISTNIVSTRAGVDRKALRALTQAIESTMRDTYECPGDHEISQDFVFNVTD